MDIRNDLGHIRRCWTLRRFALLHQGFPFFMTNTWRMKVAVRKIKGGILFIPFLLLSGLPSALAFSSLEFYGGAYHRQITEQALQPLGVSPDSLHWLYTGNLSADKIYGELFKLKYLHFTDMSFEKSEDYLEDQLEAVAEMAGDAPEDYQSYRRTLVEFGTYLHCVQDFYSHTNWIEAHLVAGVTDIPLPPADFEDFGLELISPHTMSRMMPPGEVTETEAFVKAFGKEFHTDEELAALSDRQRIELAASPTKAFIHHHLAKDNPEYSQAKLRWEKGGPTLFELALDAATRETHRQWLGLEKSIAHEHGKRADSIKKVLRGGWSSAFPDVSKPVSISLSRGEINLRRDLTLQVELVLTPTVWSRQAAEQAVELFSDLTRPEDERRRYNNEGVTDLHLIRDDRHQVFRLSYRANLVGSARSIARMRPLDEDPVHGRWEIHFQLPAGLDSVEHLIFRPHAPASWEAGAEVQPVGPEIDLSKPFAQSKEVRIVVAAPHPGWNPPELLREYLRDQDL